MSVDLKTSRAKIGKSIVCISGNLLTLKPVKRDLRPWWLHVLTYFGNLRYDDNYIKPIAMAITGNCNTFKIPQLSSSQIINTVLTVRRMDLIPLDLLWKEYACCRDYMEPSFSLIYTNLAKSVTNIV